MNETSFQKIIHDIRNMKELTNDQKNIISSLSNSQKDKLIFTYNDVFKSILYLLNDSFNNEINIYK
jgi:hypothetical protein